MAARNLQPNRGRPKQPKEVLCLNGVADEWDASETIRDRMRSSETFMDVSGSEDIVGCVKDECVLWPFLTRMSLLQTKPVPTVDALRAEVQALYEKCKRPAVAEDEANIIKISWRIRKLVGFVKMKTRREEPSRVPCPMFSCLQFCFQLSKNDCTGQICLP